jgi:hypothetical protein
MFRIFVLLCTGMICFSCGKSGVVSQNTRSLEESCDVNGNLLSCETVEGGEGSGVDILEAVIDVKVKTNETEIIFLEDKRFQSFGERITCEVSVRAGEVYQYNLSENKLWVKISNESLEWERLNDGDGLNGTWIWRGILPQGTIVRRSLSIVGTNQVIMRTNCEL